MKKTFLSVVIPGYNESKNIQSGVLEKVYEFLSQQKFIWEVLIVDDKSQDNTVKLSESFANKHKGFRISKQPHRGKGGTVIAGVLEAKGEIVLFTDMDQATPLAEFQKFIPKFKTGYDIVIGSRKGRVGAPAVRKISAS